MVLTNAGSKPERKEFSMDYLAGMLIDRLPRILEDIARLDSSEDTSGIEDGQKDTLQ